MGPLVGTRTAHAVLVVGSECATAKLLRTLRGNGYTRVSVAATGREVLALASEIRPAVVLLCLPLADESVMTVAAALKRGPPPHPRIIVLEQAVPGETASAARDPAIDQAIAADDAPEHLLGHVHTALRLHMLDVDRQDRLADLLVLEELGRLHAVDADEDSVLQAVARQIVGLAGVDFAVISGSSDERPIWAKREGPETSGDSGRAIRSEVDVRTLLSALRRRPTLGHEEIPASQLSTRPRAAAWRLGLRELLKVPLTIGSQSRGVLVVGRRDAESYTRRQAARVHHIGHLVTAMIERGLLLDEARRRAERLKRMQHVIRVVTTASEKGDMLRAAANGAVELFAADTVRVWTTTGEGSGGRLVAAVGSPTSMPEVPDALVGRVFQKGRAESSGRGRAGHTNGMRLAVPLQAGGRTFGVFAVTIGPSCDLADEAGGMLAMLADNLAVALANARLDEEAHRALERLGEVSRLTVIDKLSTSLVHDMVQPVTAALGMLEMLVDGETLSPSGQMLAERMHRALSRVGRAVHQTPDLGGGRCDRPGGVDIRGVVDDALGLVEHELRLGGIELVRQVAPDLPPVVGDADALARVFVNLLVNARDAMAGRSGRVTLSIESIASAGGDRVTVRIRDEGRGIPEAIRARMFDPLFTTKEQQQGLGLGLSISRQIVEQIGGGIDVESVEGPGTCFRVVLPIYQAPSPTQ